MSYSVIEMNCPGCGARVSTDQKTCEWCKQPVIISTFNSVYSMPMPTVNKYAGAYKKALAGSPENQDLNGAIAFCYLKLKMYQKALGAFELAMEDNFDNSETFFYAAVCLLDGKKPFVQVRATIDKILEYINAALMIEPKGIYYYFMAYVKYDYFYRKAFNTSPNFKQLLQTAVSAGVSQYDVKQLFEILQQQNPFGS